MQEKILQLYQTAQPLYLLDHIILQIYGLQIIILL